ncbi:hypothetical protein [Glycomyces terrestris]|uniref:Uncharacterized protein n=1 Tax=Glycomyces terrestris TaxID=2493553 RepID=A0A426UUM6_9ACTN|nr:hypothetical protein [Glycomyces terrestris]RRR97682.1 hypothetical protein EIW28_20080 [Glycomyces terrestris]
MTAVDTVQAAPARERIVVVAFRKAAVPRVNGYLDYLLSRGVPVTVLVADGQGWKQAPRFDPRAEVLSLARRENRQPFVWTYTLLVERGPGGVLRRAARLPGPAGGAGRRLVRAHAKAVRLIRKWFFWRGYKAVRGHSLRRIALRRLEALRLEDARRVVIADTAAVPFGWSLARRRPDLEVTRAMDVSAYEPLPVTDPAPEQGFDPARLERPYTQL